MRRMILLALLCGACASSSYVKDPTIDRELAAAEAECRERSLVPLTEPGITITTQSQNPYEAGVKAAAVKQIYDACMREHGYRKR